MKKIKETTIENLFELYKKLFKIKSNLNKNQRLVITLDTETTGKYYNKFQAEQANVNIVDKIVEIGAIFSIEESDFDKVKKNIPILDENKKDIGFRMFFNPFLDNHEPFHKEMPIEAYEVHGISKAFLEGKDKIEVSNEILEEPAPSIHEEFLLNNEKVTYIEYLMKIINLADVFIAHNAPFDVGMINEAVNDQNNIFLLNEIKDRKVEHYKNEIIDTLKLFRDSFPRQRLIARQQLETPSTVNHKLDHLMLITKQPKRDLHGAFWDSKLLIDAYSVFLDDILKFDIFKNIVIKKTNYLNNFNLTNNHNKIISINKVFEKELEKIFNKNSFFKKEEMEKHLKLQLDNINKGKKNLINENQINLSIIYFKIFFNKNKYLNNLDLIEEQFGKVRNKSNEKLYEEMKTSKLFTKKELSDFEKFIKLNKNNEIIMSHYLVQALFHFYKYKIEQEVLFPIILDSYKNINSLISKKQENTIINIEKNQKIIYFRSDGSIATKNNSLTTVIGSINDWNSLFLKLKEENITNLILMDFNSIVNYIKFEKALKEFNKNEEDFHISINYGLTTLCKVNEFDFEINIISKNEKGFREFPQILANTYKDKIKNEEAYKNPYINIEYFKKINSNENLYVTLGGYEGLIERVLFSTIENKEEFIFNIIDKIYNKNSELIIETYQSDIFLYEYKKNIINKLKKKYEKIKNIYTEPLVYLENDREYHEVRCSKYNDKIYDLKNLNIIENYKENNIYNKNYKSLDLKETFIPKDPVIIPSLISDINFIKERRPKLYKELTLLKDENGNLFNLEDNSSENINKIQLQYFRIKAREGLEERFVENNISKEAQEYYNKRFAFEMKIIEDMKFDGYTLLVDDFLKVLVRLIEGLIGPGRGSAAGSLVSWAYRITEVDPMLEYKSPEKHLLFERYLNPERISLPDIDMDMNGLINKNNLLVKLKKLNEEDFSKTINDFILIIENKYEMEEYVAGKALIEDYQTALYGKETIAKIVTRDTYQAKSAIAAVCKYLGDDFARTSDFRFDVKEKPYIKFASIIAGDAFEKVGSSFKKVFDPEHDLYNKYLVNLYNSNNAVKKVVDLARKLEGTIANYGVHAAGLVILDKENNYLNNGYMIIGGINVTLLDGKHVEDYINIKFDFLGLASLEEIDKTLQFIEKKHGKTEKEKALSILSNEYKLYSDKILFERIFDIQNTKKIFQFSSDGMQDLVKRVKPDSFDDLVAITALYRPGPMDSGMTDMYVDYKNNPEKIFYEFKELEQILKPTYSTIVFQEQVMKIVQELGGFSLGGADLVRRAMGKKIKEELDKLKGQFIDGTLKKYENNHLTINTLKRSAIENKSIIFIDKNKNMKFYTIEKFNDLKIFPTIYTNENIGDIIFEDNLMKEFDIEEKEITKLLADNLFENIIKFAGYGFNKSHSVAYTNVSMRMAWLKAHYPLEFFASIFVNNSDDIDKLSEYIIDSKKNNVSLFGIDINNSNYTFDIIENFIIYGLSNIKGISNNDIKFILKDRNKNGKYKNFADFLKRFLYSEYKGSLNTIEHLINVGAFDSINLNKEDLMKVKSSKINLNLDESKLEKLNKILMKQLEVENGLFFDFNYFNSMTLEEKAIELFNLNKNDINVLLPLLFNKILNSDEKQLNSIMKNKKSTISSFEKNINSFNEFKEKIEIPENYILNKDLKLKRNLLNKLTKLIDSENISESFLESIENDFEKSIIEMSKIEYDLTGSTSSFGSVLENEYIINKIGDYEALNILNNDLKQEGQFLYTSTLKNIISGENNEGKIYTNLVIEDINHIEKRFYLSPDQIFRFKNNLEIGDILLLDIKIKENNEKFYEKLINIEVFKENQDFKRFKAFNDPKLSIKDLKIKDIQKEYGLNLELYTLDEIEEDWKISQVQWPKLKDDENFKVILFLNGYKEIISKKTGKKYQIIEVSDGLSNNYLELLYSDLDLSILENNKGNPVIVELQKNKENGFGISAGYQTGLIFIDKKFIHKNYKSNINLTPVLDGKTHINIYTKGKTELGRMLSNLSSYPVKLKHNNKIMTFKSLEGYWYFLRILFLDETERFEFLEYDGFKAKEEGSKIVKNLKLNKEDEKKFQNKIKEALTLKIIQNKKIYEKLLVSELPLFHYFYDNENKVKELPQYQWMVDHISKIRDGIKVKENYINKIDLTFNLKNSKIEIININNTPEYDFYCGRPKEGQISPLGNPFKIDYNNEMSPEEQRELVLNKYDKHLRKAILNEDIQIISELENIIDFIQKNRIVRLGCFCAPKRCHCESIKKELKELIDIKIND